MRSATRTIRAQALAIPRPQVEATYEWLATVLVVALLIAAVLLP